MDLISVEVQQDRVVLESSEGVLYLSFDDVQLLATDKKLCKHKDRIDSISISFILLVSELPGVEPQHRLADAWADKSGIKLRNHNNQFIRISFSTLMDVIQQVKEHKVVSRTFPHGRCRTC